MKILSLNIGIKIDNAEEVVKYLKEVNADIICLQEVVRPLEDGVLPLFRSEEVIRKNLKKSYPYYFFAPEWVADMHYRAGGDKPDKVFGGMIEQGKMILSKYPIEHGYNYFYHKVYEFDRERRDFYEGNDHGRSLQTCHINNNGKILQLGNVHGCYSLDRRDTERSIKQSNFIIEKLSLNNLPTILLGDFNVLSDTESIKILEKKYKNLIKDFNIKSTRPHKEQIIDYIFVDQNFSNKIKSFKVDNTDISDHYPLILEID